MRRKVVILILLYLSWVVINIHRLWNNTEPVMLHPFPYDKDYEVSWHWYIHMLLKDAHYILIFLALWLRIRSNVKRDKSVTVVFGAVFLNQLIDLPHFILAARHSEKILTLQGAIMLSTGVILIINSLITRKNRKPWTGQ